MLKLLTVKRAKLTLHFGSSNLLQHNSALPPPPPLPTPVTTLMARALPEQHRVFLELLSGAMRVMYKTPLIC